jgi:cellulose biosynthesis protein BcsQ
MELNQLFKRPEDIRVVGLLPVMVNQRLAMTEPIMESLRRLSAQRDVPLLPAVRTDTTVVKASKDRKFLPEYDPKCKAWEDNKVVADRLIEFLSNEHQTANA